VLSIINERQSAHEMQVLVVDDNEEFTELFAMELRSGGYTVQVAGDGPNALRIASEQPPDVIFTDLTLPGMDGYELARRLRVQVAPQNPVIIALTGSDRDSDRIRSKAEGFAFHLVKPVEPSLLRLLVETLTGKKLRTQEYPEDD
jgi:CheY-like chemotaxis protein